MKKCMVLCDYHNDRGKKRKAGTKISLPDTAAKMRENGGFVEILNPDKITIASKPAANEEEATIVVTGLDANRKVVSEIVAILRAGPVKKPEIKMQNCKVLITFFDGKRRTIGEKVKLTDSEANRHALAGRVKIIKSKPKKKPAAPKPKAISSDKKSAGALAKKKPKKKPARGKKK